MCGIPCSPFNSVLHFVAKSAIDKPGRLQGLSGQKVGQGEAQDYVHVDYD